MLGNRTYRCSRIDREAVMQEKPFADISNEEEMDIENLLLAWERGWNEDEKEWKKGRE